jgi:hypothetical protein
MTVEGGGAEDGGGVAPNLACLTLVVTRKSGR